MLGGELAVLQAPMLDGLLLDPYGSPVPRLSSNDILPR
jgi:hypothetical protein